MIKKKTTYTRQEYEYQSDDGEKYNVSIVKTDDRCYIQWNVIVEENEGSKNLESITIDAKMLEGMYEVYKEMMGLNVNPNFKKPRIVDHRNSPNSFPIESFNNSNQSVWDSKEGAISVQTGIDVNEQDEVPETSESIKNQIDGETKEEIEERKNKGKSDYNPFGSEGVNFKRKVGASDLI